MSITLKPEIEHVKYDYIMTLITWEEWSRPPADLREWNNILQFAFFNYAYNMLVYTLDHTENEFPEHFHKYMDMIYNQQRTLTNKRETDPSKKLLPKHGEEIVKYLYETYDAILRNE